MPRRHDEDDEIREAKISRVPRHDHHRSSSAQRYRRNEFPSEDSFSRRLGPLRISSIGEHSSGRADASSNTPRNIGAPRTSAHDTSRPSRFKEVDRADRNTCGWSCSNDVPSGMSRSDNQQTSRSSNGQPPTRFHNTQECGGWGSLARKFFGCDNNRTTLCRDVMNELVLLREQHDLEMKQVQLSIQEVFHVLKNLVPDRGEGSDSSWARQSTSDTRMNDHTHHSRRAQSAPRTRANRDRQPAEEPRTPRHVRYAEISFDPSESLFREVVRFGRSCLEKFVTALIRYEDQPLQMGYESDQISNPLRDLVGRLYPGVRFHKRWHFKHGVQAWLSNLAIKGFDKATMSGDSQQDIRRRQVAAWREFQALTAVSPTNVINEEESQSNRDFSSFCQRMMDAIQKNTRFQEWPYDLDVNFLEAMKHAWRMRKLALVFEPTASSIKVKHLTSFDANFMDALEAPEDGITSPFASQVALLVNPGFIVQERVVKCEVYLTLHESPDF